jgi:hypothetical protein
VEVVSPLRIGGLLDLAVGVSTIADFVAGVAAVVGFAAGVGAAVTGLVVGADAAFKISVRAAVEAESSSSSAGSGARFGSALTGSS